MQPYQSLVEAALSGDQPAFDQLVRSFGDAAREWAFQVLGDRLLAEDVAQESFLVAYRQLHQLRDTRAFPAWLKRIVISQCHRITRRAAPLSPLEDETNLPESAHDPAVEVEHREMEAALRKAVAGLPAGERAVTEMFYIVGYSQAEIAEQLQLPLTTIKKRLQYARERLKETMSEQIVAALRLDHDTERFTGTPPLAMLPLPYGYIASYSDQPTAPADEFEDLIAFLQQQQLIPTFE